MIPIPNYLEQLIHQGKAEAKVYTGGLSNECEIYCPPGSYLAVYGYYYKPYMPNYGNLYNPATPLYPYIDFQNSIQYVGFGYQGKFASFIHSVDLDPNVVDTFAFTTAPETPGSGDRRAIPSLEVQARCCYIISNTNIGISFSQLTSNSIVSNTNGLLPDNNNILANLGYGNISQFFTFQNYLNNAATPEYMSLSYDIASRIVSFSPTFNFSNQLFTNPGAGGALLDPNLYADTLAAMGKARMPHINVLYVQVNEQKPINLV